jgi:hypothetical protein
VITIAHLHGLKKKNLPAAWSKKDDALLKKLYKKIDLQDIADRLGRSVPAVAVRTHKLGISEPKRIWSRKEINTLKRLYPTKTAEEIANKLGRPIQATRLRIVKLGLRKRSYRGKM